MANEVATPDTVTLDLIKHQTICEAGASLSIYFFLHRCGYRGGYCEAVNLDPDVRAMLMKSISAKLCPSVSGQAAMDVVVNPPKPGEPSYDLWKKVLVSHPMSPPTQCRHLL